MSNFLQRIAASVIPASDESRTKARLQPTLGSVYMPADSRLTIGADLASSAISETTETVATSGAQGGGYGRIRREGLDAILPGRYEMRGMAASPGEELDAGDHDSPLLPLGDYVQSLVRSSLADLKLGAEGHAPLKDLPVQESGITVFDGERQQSQVPGTQNPKSEHANFKTIQPVVTPPLIASQARAAQALRSGVTSNRPMRGQSDEVHIHIGRIEVAAITPPAIRTPGQERRKPMSLDEYMRKFGNGGRG